ncbi:hypothetical protein SUGI_0307660 [Cryptomeria japonica]|nr:hypothetical protein SUGI_0307660 [Cryptomeria japonica]
MGKRKMVSCASCRVHRKKCSEVCILAQYFPPDDPDKFAIVQRVFRTGHIGKLLQGLEVEQREDAVNVILKCNSQVSCLMSAIFCSSYYRIVGI